MLPNRIVPLWLPIAGVVIWFGAAWFGLSRGLMELGIPYWTRILVLSLASLGIVGAFRSLLDPVRSDRP